MRSVKSRSVFEQMKGRGVRVISDTDFQSVTPDAKTKTHFVIVDAVGVCERNKTDSRPLEQKPSVPLEKLMEHIAIGAREPELLSSLASRLVRLEKRIERDVRAEVEKLSGGKTLSNIARDLLDAIDPDKVEHASRLLPEDRKPEAYATLAAAAVAPIATNPDLRNKILQIQRAADQTIDTVSQDKLLFAGADAKTSEAARDTIRSFRDYIEQHKAEIEALQILYSRPFRKRLTEESLRELEAKLKPEFGPQPVPTIWNAFSCSSGSASRSSQTRRFTDLVSLVRTAIEPTTPLEPFEDHVRQRFATWLRRKDASVSQPSTNAGAARTNSQPASRPGTIAFTADQLAWLEKMRDYISASGSVDREHLEADNVLGPMYKTFGAKLWPLMDELNLTLAA